MLTYKNTLKLLIGLLFLVIVFHLLIILKAIPFNIVWGGRLKTEQEMLVFEGVSIALNLFLVWILSFKFRNLKNNYINAVLWIFFLIFSLNTIGNLLAHTLFEKFFSLLTLVFALLILKILLKRQK